VYFTAGLNAGTAELWRTDGSAEGTTRATGLAPQGPAGQPRALATFGGLVYFTGSDGAVHGGLFGTNGTAAGTYLVKDLDPGGSAFLGQATVVGDRVVFAATTSAAGEELWTSDGTAAGTRMLIDLEPGSAGTVDSTPFAMFNTVVWAGFTSAGGVEPYAWTAQASTTVARPKSSYTRKQARKRRIKVPVVVAGAPGLTGTVTLWKGSTRLGTAEVVAGKAVVRITKRLKRGKHKVRAVYAGSWKAGTSTSRLVVVKVR
jgi:ELWxxDGT repeat protein